MLEFVRGLVQPIVEHPDDVAVQVTEGEAVTLIEVSVHADDYDTVQGEKGRTLRAIRNLVSAAAGGQKASLELVDANKGSAEE